MTRPKDATVEAASEVEETMEEESTLIEMCRASRASTATARTVRDVVDVAANVER